MSANRFNWRPMVTAPVDGSPIVNMKMITYVGGWHRTIDVQVELQPMRREFLDPIQRDIGYWSFAGRSVSGSENGWWTSPEEFAAAVPEETWEVAPDDLFGVGPIVFVRPTQPRLEYDGPVTPRVYSADVVWNGSHHGREGWRSAVVSQPGKHLAVGFLNGENVNGLPFRWCTLAEFFPAEAFDRMVDMANNVHTYAVNSIARWRNQQPPTSR